MHPSHVHLMNSIFFSSWNRTYSNTHKNLLALLRPSMNLKNELTRTRETGRKVEKGCHICDAFYYDQWSHVLTCCFNYFVFPIYTILRSIDIVQSSSFSSHSNILHLNNVCQLCNKIGHFACFYLERQTFALAVINNIGDSLYVYDHSMIRIFFMYNSFFMNSTSFNLLKFNK